MLSYQHIYHAGSLADVHKHAVLSVLLARLTQKEKPLSYLETHAGRGLYDLSAPEARKTGEAATGIEAALAKKLFPADHPYLQAVLHCRKSHGPHYYPGSPALAAHFLRPTDQMHFMELHPQEIKHLRKNISGASTHIHKRDGYEGALALSPLQPRRGLIFIDPSYEVKDEYETAAAFVPRLHRKWPEAAIVAWYPLLGPGRHRTMTARWLQEKFTGAVLQEVRFATPAHEGLRGSGIFIINCPFGAERELKDIKDIVSRAARTAPTQARKVTRANSSDGNRRRLR